MTTIVTCTNVGCKYKKNNGNCGKKNITIGKVKNSNMDSCQDFKIDMEWFRQDTKRLVSKTMGG